MKPRRGAPTRRSRGHRDGNAGPPSTGHSPVRRLPSLTTAETEALVLHRDGLVLVLNKPAGLPVHAGPGGGPNLEDCFVHLQFGLPAPPALAHRLDRDTSGCLVLGRHRKALSKLGRLFREGRVGKVYWALLSGVPEGEHGTIDAPLAKVSTRSGGWRMEIAADSQPSVTDWRLLGQGDGLSWVEFRPRTGRTHQIRVHAAHALGCPVLGDAFYGTPDKPDAPDTPDAPNALKSGGPMMLHSRAITLPLQATKPPLSIEAPPPEPMAERLRAIIPRT